MSLSVLHCTSLFLFVCVCVFVCQGRRNFVILLLAVCFALAGSTLTGLSKWDNSAASQNTTTTSVTTTSSNSNAVTNLVTSI